MKRKMVNLIVKRTIVSLAVGLLIGASGLIFNNKEAQAAQGWVKDNNTGSWVYYNGNNTKAKGWLFLNKRWYYLDPNSGEMYTGSHFIDGVENHFTNDGTWICAVGNGTNSVTAQQQTTGFGDQVADANCDKGHSISQVTNEWNKLKPVFKDSNIFNEAPSTKAPYKTGKVNKAYLNDCLNYINFARYLAGIDSLKLDSDLTEQAQYGAVLTAANKELEHEEPKHPSGMDENFYKIGQESTSSSNLSTSNLYKSIQSCLNDNHNLKGSSNIGHREWLLDPKVTKIGLGTAENYSVQNLPFGDFDKSVDNPDILAWPSEGAFPNMAIARDAVWSIDLNKDVYDIDGDVKVKITRLCDNKQWNLNKVDSFSAQTTGFKVLDYNPYGFGSKAHTIIFHIGSSDLPVQQYLGKYKVEISGLNKNVEYTINFFTLS